MSGIVEVVSRPEIPRFTVSEITRRIRGLIEEGFPVVSVEGEISNFRPSSNGHLYFSLKDQEALLSAVMFRGRAASLPFQPKDGMLVRATGNLSVYEKRGVYQIVCESLQRAGEGDILAMLEERKRRLAAEGLFDSARKKRLPQFPRRVAVITSPTGAAVRDILRVLKRRAAGIDLVILPTPVQGEEAGGKIAAQIRLANRFRMADVLIVGRGGGSLEDLLPFSDEEVVRAIAASAIPVISAVGHETDVTLSDLAADVRAPTPSAAAEMVSASREELQRRVAEAQEQMTRVLARQLDRVRLLLDRFKAESLERNMRLLVQPQWQRLDDARERIAEGMRRHLTDDRHRLELLAQSIDSRSPLAILERGYAVVSHAKTGRVLTSAADVAAGAPLRIRLHKGRLRASVEEIERDEEL